MRQRFGTMMISSLPNTRPKPLQLTLACLDCRRGSALGRRGPEPDQRVPACHGKQCSGGGEGAMVVFMWPANLFFFFFLCPLHHRTPRSPRTLSTRCVSTWRRTSRSCRWAVLAVIVNLCGFANHAITSSLRNNARSSRAAAWTLTTSAASRPRAASFPTPRFALPSRSLRSPRALWRAA